MKQNNNTHTSTNVWAAHVHLVHLAEWLWSAPKQSSARPGMPRSHVFPIFPIKVTSISDGFAGQIPMNHWLCHWKSLPWYSTAANPGQQWYHMIFSGNLLHSWFLDNLVWYFDDLPSNDNFRLQKRVVHDVFQQMHTFNSISGYIWYIA